MMGKYSDVRIDIERECTKTTREITRLVEKLESELGLPIFIQVETDDVRAMGGSFKPFHQTITLKPVL